MKEGRNEHLLLSPDTFFTSTHAPLTPSCCRFGFS